MMREIVIVGVLDVVHSTNIGMAKGFMQNGCGVTPFNYRKIIGKYGLQFFGELLVNYVIQRKPHLVLFCKCNGIDPQIVTECSKYSKTWLFNMDPIQTIQQCPEILQHARNSTYSSCTGTGVVDWFKSQGVENCDLYIQGVDPDVYKPVSPNSEFSSDISFIGTRVSSRDKIINEIKELGYNINLYGPGYDREARNKEFATICSSSKFMLSIDTQAIPGYFSNRIQRMMLCGSCIIHYDPTRTIHQFFTKDKILSFHALEEFKNAMNISDEDRKIMGIKARDLILSEYTWEIVIKKMLDKCDK